MTPSLKLLCSGIFLASGALGSQAGTLQNLLIEHAGGAPVTLSPSESRAVRLSEGDRSAVRELSLLLRSENTSDFSVQLTRQLMESRGIDRVTIETPDGPRVLWKDGSRTMPAADQPIISKPLTVSSVDPARDAEKSFLPVKSSPSTEAAAGFPGEVIDEVIVPVPSELFLVLDKLGKHDWKGELRSGKQPTFTDRTVVALLLGTVVAEGFIAVQAQDAAAVERIGKDVLRLSESLGLKETVLPHTNRILESSKNGHWEIVRVEFDKTQKTVRDTMEQRRDRDQSQCVSLGGWLRGTEAVTDLITQNYTSDAAELLNQPDIVRHFSKVLEKMAGSNGKLVNMRDGLKEIAQVIGAGDEPPAASGVQAIHATTARLVKTITTAKSSK